MSEKSITVEIADLKQQVKQVIGQVNALKDQLERREITLEVFKEKKEVFENELRAILEKISQYKERGTVENKKDATLASEANKLMYEFQTEFPEEITKPKVYISASVDDHFIFEIDFTNYPGKPILKSPDSLLKLFEVPFDQKISLLKSWSSQTPAHIIEIFYEVERILLRIFQSEQPDETAESDVNARRIRKIFQRRKLVASAEYEIELKNFDKAIELYQRILQISYELEDFEQANKYTKLVAELKKSRRPAT
jgi:hypothetical protein